VDRSWAHATRTRVEDAARVERRLRRSITDSGEIAARLGGLVAAVKSWLMPP
jgi:hypothetical protein